MSSAILHFDDDNKTEEIHNYDELFIFSSPQTAQSLCINEL